MTAITKARFMDGLVLWLPMAEGAGTRLNDLSMYGNNGVFGGAPTWVIGEDGLPSLSFDGDDDQVVVAHSPSLNLGNVGDEYTILMHVTQTDTRDYTARVMQKPGAGYPFDIRMSEGDPNVSLAVYAGASNPLCILSLTLNQRATVGFIVKREDTITGYKDLEAPVIVSDSTEGDARNAGAIQIGGIVGKFAPIDLDDLRIYNRALDRYEFRAYHEAVRKI